MVLNSSRLVLFRSNLGTAHLSPVYILSTVKLLPLILLTLLPNSTRSYRTLLIRSPPAWLTIIMGDSNAAILSSPAALFSANIKENRNAPLFEEFLSRSDFKPVNTLVKLSLRGRLLKDDSLVERVDPMEL